MGLRPVVLFVGQKARDAPARRDPSRVGHGKRARARPDCPRARWASDQLCVETRRLLPRPRPLTLASSAPADLLESPLASLFPSYLPFYLPDGRSPLHALSQEILDVVYPPPPPETPRASTSTSAPAGFDAAKLWFRKGLREDLWGSPATGGGRASSGLLKRLGMAEFFAVRAAFPLPLPFSRSRADPSLLFTRRRSGTDRTRPGSPSCRTSCPSWC